MMHCGLLGQRLGHSYSPQIHNRLADYEYLLYEKEPDQLESFLRNGNFSGLNVTIPYKKTVLPLLDELSPIAHRLGAVNTIVKTASGALIGHNSDYYGFRSMVQKSGLCISGKKVLVLGSGGASNTAVAVLEEMGGNVVVISRSGQNNYQNLHNHADAKIIVNTTPIGMYPHTGQSPVNLNQFPQLEGVLDVIYNPARTQLLMDAEQRGLITCNGLWMLVAQAKESAEWFTGTEIPDGKIAKIYHSLKNQMENIILVGMPGCGKSTLGKRLAEQLGKKFVDADQQIVVRCGMEIPEIFSTFGEDHFRQTETKVLSELGKESGMCIATGGGCVTRPENYVHLRQNGIIIWLKRDLESLPTNGRPLSQKGSLSEMYRQRQPLYERFADYTADNNGEIRQTMENIITCLEETP